MPEIYLSLAVAPAKVIKLKIFTINYLMEVSPNIICKVTVVCHNILVCSYVKTDCGKITPRQQLMFLMRGQYVSAQRSI